MLKKPKLADQLPRSFYEQSTEVVARDLIGKALLRRICLKHQPSKQAQHRWIGGIVVETEAYLSKNDPACHSSRGKTKSNAAMFMAPGTLYVYPIHAKYCMNVVTDPKGIAAAVLIRAIEPAWGIPQMQNHRGYQEHRRLTRGPGMLCAALKVDREDDGIDIVTDIKLAILECESPWADPITVVATPRIGISKAKDLPLRFAVAENRFVSGKICRRAQNDQPSP